MISGKTTERYDQIYRGILENNAYAIAGSLVKYCIDEFGETWYNSLDRFTSRARYILIMSKIRKHLFGPKGENDKRVRTILKYDMLLLLSTYHFMYELYLKINTRSKLCKSKRRRKMQHYLDKCRLLGAVFSVSFFGSIVIHKDIEGNPL